MRRKLIPALVLMTPLEVVSRCNHIRVPGVPVTRTSRMVLQTRSFSRMKSIAARHGHAHGIFDIFSRKGKSCYHDDSRCHNVYTTQSAIGEQQ